jgi:hypothetical protein
MLGDRCGSSGPAEKAVTGVTRYRVYEELPILAGNKISLRHHL